MVRFRGLSCEESTQLFRLRKGILVKKLPAECLRRQFHEVIAVNDKRHSRDSDQGEIKCRTRSAAPPARDNGQRPPRGNGNSRCKLREVVRVPEAGKRSCHRKQKKSRDKNGICSSLAPTPNGGCDTQQHDRKISAKDVQQRIAIRG